MHQEILRDTLALVMEALQRFGQVCPTPQRRVRRVRSLRKFRCRNFLPLRDTKRAVEGSFMFYSPSNPFTAASISFFPTRNSLTNLASLPLGHCNCIFSKMRSNVLHCRKATTTFSLSAFSKPYFFFTPPPVARPRRVPWIWLAFPLSPL